MSKKNPSKKKLSKKLSAKFHDFIINHPPAQVSKHLRCILLDYISAQSKTGFAPDFDVYICELYDLFELLDAAGERVES